MLLHVHLQGKIGALNHDVITMSGPIHNRWVKKEDLTAKLNVFSFEGIVAIIWLFGGLCYFLDTLFSLEGQK